MVRWRPWGGCLCRFAARRFWKHMLPRSGPEAARTVNYSFLGHASQSEAERARDVCTKITASSSTMGEAFQSVDLHTLAHLPPAARCRITGEAFEGWWPPCPRPLHLRPASKMHMPRRHAGARAGIPVRSMFRRIRGGTRGPAAAAEHLSELSTQAVRSSTARWRRPAAVADTNAQIVAVCSAVEKQTFVGKGVLQYGRCIASRACAYGGFSQDSHIACPRNCRAHKSPGVGPSELSYV